MSCYFNLEFPKSYVGYRSDKSKLKRFYPFLPFSIN